MNHRKGTVVGLLLLYAGLIVGLSGCPWDSPSQWETLPVTRDEVLGVWLHRNKEGRCILELRDDGMSRQVCIREGESKPFFDSGWQEWTFDPKRPSDDMAGIWCHNVLSVRYDGTGGFGESPLTAMRVSVFKYEDGRVVLESGFMDLDVDKGPYGNWRRISEDEFPPWYKPSQGGEPGVERPE